MDVCAQSGVIGQVPTRMVRVLVNHDLVRVPEPVVAEVDVIGSHEEVETAKPKPIRSPSRKAPNMVFAKTARESSMLPRVIEVIVRIVRPRVVPDPFVAFHVYVRRFGMARLVGVSRAGGCIGLMGSRRRGMLRTMIRSRAVRRDVPAAYFRLASALRKSW